MAAENTSVVEGEPGASGGRTSFDGLGPALRRLDTLLERAVATAQRVYGREAAADSFRGLYISQGEIGRLLAREPGAPTLNADSERTEKILPEALSECARLRWLAQAFGLSSFDAGVVLIALAPELDLRYGRLYAYLQDDVTKKRPSVDLALNLLCPSAEERVVRRRHFGSGGPLIRHGLLHLIPDLNQPQSPLLARYIKLDEQIVGLLLGQEGLDARLAPFSRIVKPAFPPDDPSLDNETRASLRGLVLVKRETREPLRLYFQGPRVTFEPALDKLNQGIVTALFIVHAGRGAEVMPPQQRGAEIWSHKWNMPNPVQVGANLSATIYLVVPNDCKVGVCAHELGHLAFQWQDFYDPNYDEDGHEWDGSGVWDLMAGGSYNGNGARPAHPAGLHKLQHGWINVTSVKKSRSLTLKPYTPKSGRVYKIMSPKYQSKQCLVLENRSRVGFDFDLPGEGLLAWRVDETGEMEAAEQPGMLLVQADGRHDLETPNDWNEGDAGDPFPGSAGRMELKDTGSISTSFPGGPRSGVTLKNIRRDPSTGVVKLSVAISTGGPSPVGRAAGRKSKPSRTGSRRR